MDGTTTTVIDTILETASTVVEWSGDMLTLMIENPVYAFMFAGSFIGIGLAIVRKFSRTAKRS